MYDPVLAVNECDVYSGAKSNTSKLFGITTGNVFDDYVYKTDYPTIGDTVWYNIYFPAEKESFKARQYVRYKGGSWTTRDVTLSHIIDEDRRFNAQRFEEQFYGTKGLRNVVDGYTVPTPSFLKATELKKKEESENEELIRNLMNNPEAVALLKALSKQL